MSGDLPRSARRPLQLATLLMLFTAVGLPASSVHAECVGVGDGVVDLGEECDGDGAGNAGETATCDTDCTFAVCGDGALNVTAGEACDDGNTIGGDNCAFDCSDERSNLRVLKTVDDATPSVNQLITYTVTVRNAGSGSDIATHVEVTDVLPGGLTFTAFDDSDRGVVCSETSGTVTCVLASLDPPPGAGVLYTITATVDAGQQGNTIVNTASETAMDQAETNVANNESQASMIVAACGDGIIEGSEACDGDGVGGGGETKTCNDDCSISACGDGILNPTAGEACDDGNIDPGDGCDEGCTIEPCPQLAILDRSALESTDYPCDASLSRVGHNVLRFAFDIELTTVPVGGDIEIRELLDGGLFGDDLFEFFDFSIDGNVLTIVEDGCRDGTCDFHPEEATCLDGPDVGSPCPIVLANEVWYGIINTGKWCDVADFEVNYAAVYGDANNDLVTGFTDLSAIEVMFIDPDNVSDDSRFDINTIGGVGYTDFSASNAFVGSSALLSEKPTGHECFP